MSILDTIVEKTILRVEELKSLIAPDIVRKRALGLKKSNFEFEKALSSGDISFICEVKKASPSKGLITEDFDYIKTAREYQEAGASAISCLTEPYWFLGKDEYLTEISKNVSIPILRKDFTVDEYQIYEAKLIGASAVLLICSVLDDEKLRRYIEIADTLGLSCLVEAHSEDELKRAIKAGARVIGVNNRDLKTFDVDINNSIRLRHLAPKDLIFVSESGIKTHEDIDILRKNNVNAVLIGETLMKSPDKKAELIRLRGSNDQD